MLVWRRDIQLRLLSAIILACLHPVTWAQQSDPEAIQAKRTRPTLVAQPQTPLDGLVPVTTKSGLTYYDINVGTGKAATPHSRVAIDYVCWLADGTTFDSSAKLGKPATLRLHKPEIIEGWKEGIGSMREGGIRRLDVPWELAYGEKGKDPVGPKQDLVFEIRLVKVLDDEELAPSDAIVEKPLDAASVPPPFSTEGITPRKTESGLTIWEIVPGDVAKPKPASLVSVEYTCRLKDGTPVESSAQQGRPQDLDLRTAAEGLREAIVGMKVGGKIKADIPAALAYGTKGKAPRIPPNADLSCDVKLESILVEDLVQAELDPSSSAKLLVAPPGIPMTRTESGLKIWDLVLGEGSMPGPDAQVTIRYSGWLTDGTLFDSSDHHGGTTTFPLKAALKGWKEGIGSMKVGGKRRLEVPPDLGYGAAERGSPVPPNSTLVFEIELLEVR